MTQGLEVTICDTLEGTTATRQFRKSTVRIGRNPLNDLHLEQNFVSQFHAVVELSGSSFVLRDLGSTNGSIVAGQKVANAAVPLPEGDPSFAILGLKLTVRAIPLSDIPEAQSQRRPLAVTGLLQAPPAELFDAMEGESSPAEKERLAELHKKYRAAWAELYQALQDAVLKRSPEKRGSFVASLSAELPGVSGEPDFHRLAEMGGAHSLTVRDPQQEQRIALEGLRELASEYVPHQPPPETPDELVRFLTRIRGVLDVFLGAFLPLREGQRQFQQELGLHARSAGPGDPVEQAGEVQELSAALLAPDASTDAFGSVESVFADMMIHHVAMLNGIMTGVKTLLGEISPSAVKEAAEQLASRGVLGRSFGGPGYKQLWQAFEQRHADLAGEEKQLFALLFGRRFTQAYSEAASDGIEKNTDKRTLEPGPMRAAHLAGAGDSSKDE